MKIVWGGCSDLLAELQISVCSGCGVAVVICASKVNIQTHTETDR